MSGEPTSTDPGPEKSDATTVKKKSKAAPARSPIERSVVWGLIAVLIVIVGWEFTAHLGYTKALRGFKERIAQSETGKSFLAADLPDVVGGKAPSSHEETSDSIYGRCIEEVYKWNGPIRKRAIHVILTLGKDSEVVDYSTEGMTGPPTDDPDVNQPTGKEEKSAPALADPAGVMGAPGGKAPPPEPKAEEPSKT